MNIRRIVSFTFLLVLPALSAQAKPGKIFFANGRWLKGDIQIQEEGGGQAKVVVAMPSGSLIFPKSEVKNIVYAPDRDESAARFHRALNNTPRTTARAGSPALYEAYIEEASLKNRLDPELVKAVIKQESNFNRQDVSNKGALGLMQLMPDTARKLGVEDVFDPWENIHGGTRYLRYMLENFNGDLSRALAAYNAGPGAVKKYGAIPPYRETQDYVRSVLRYYQMYRGSRLVSFEDRQGRWVITDKSYLPK